LYLKPVFLDFVFLFVTFSAISNYFSFLAHPVVDLARIANAQVELPAI